MLGHMTIAAMEPFLLDSATGSSKLHGVFRWDLHGAVTRFLSKVLVFVHSKVSWSYSGYGDQLYLHDRYIHIFVGICTLSVKKIY